MNTFVHFIRTVELWALVTVGSHEKTKAQRDSKSCPGSQDQQSYGLVCSGVVGQKNCLFMREIEPQEWVNNICIFFKVGI